MKEDCGMARIGIPVLNGGSLLLRLLRSIDTTAEIYVIFNRIGPHDEEVADALHTFAAEKPELITALKVEQVDGNFGVAGSWNRILDHFQGDCLICNSDIEFTPMVLREALQKIRGRPELTLQWLYSHACFYAARDFTAKLGWFDENFYPAYHEDQEMTLRRIQLGVLAANVPSAGGERVRHGGSQTLQAASPAQRRFIQVAMKRAGEYLRRRWGALPPPGVAPEHRHPFHDSRLDPSDWVLDLPARASLARECEVITGYPCPIRFHRARGGRAESGAL
jgi:hypothetical protein